MPPSAAAAHAAVTGGSALLEMLHKSGQMGSNCKAVVGAAQVIICKENQWVFRHDDASLTQSTFSQSTYERLATADGRELDRLAETTSGKKVDFSDWHVELEVRLLQGRNFCRQRIIVTDRIIALGYRGVDVFDDVIPLHDIDSIQDLSDDSRGEGTWHHNRGMIAVHTLVRGYNLGRKYLLQVKTAKMNSHKGGDVSTQTVTQTWTSPERLRELPAVLQDIVRKAKDVENQRNASLYATFKRSRLAVRAAFQTTAVQVFVAILIVLNFFVNAYEAQMADKLLNEDGSLGEAAKLLETVDVAFTTVFTLELIFNMYAHLVWDFVTDGWCIFDFIIVTVSLLNPLFPGGQGSLVKTFRLLRAFRVLRIFGRVGSIRSIINALIKSLVPVLNAFFIMFIVLALYAIIGVTFFSETAPADFGNLSLGIIALFRIAAGETWVESQDVSDGEGNVNWGTGAFVMSFILIINWTLLQVGMAVLLDTFVSETSREQEEATEKLLQEKRVRDTMGNVLDPLLRMIVTEYIDGAHLEQLLGELFVVMCSDKKVVRIMKRFLKPEMSFAFRKWKKSSKSLQANTHLHATTKLEKIERLASANGFEHNQWEEHHETLDCQDICQAFSLMRLEPRMHFTELDYAALTRNGKLADSNGNLGLPEFLAIMRGQVHGYITRKLQRQVSESSHDFASLAAIKMMSHEVTAIHNQLTDVRSGMAQLQLCMQSLLMGAGGGPGEAAKGNGEAGVEGLTNGSTEPPSCFAPASARQMKKDLSHKLSTLNTRHDSVVSIDGWAPLQGQSARLPVPELTKDGQRSAVEHLLGTVTMLREHQKREMQQLRHLIQHQPEVLSHLANLNETEMGEQSKMIAGLEPECTPRVLLNGDPQVPVPAVTMDEMFVARRRENKALAAEGVRNGLAAKDRDGDFGESKSEDPNASVETGQKLLAGKRGQGKSESMSNGFWNSAVGESAGKPPLPFIDEWRERVTSTFEGLDNNFKQLPSIASSLPNTGPKIRGLSFSTPRQNGQISPLRPTNTATTYDSVRSASASSSAPSLVYDSHKKVWIQRARNSPPPSQSRENGGGGSSLIYDSKTHTFSSPWPRSLNIGSNESVPGAKTPDNMSKNDI